MSIPRSAQLLLAALVAAMPFASAGSADEGDPAGWSISTDPRGRAFLRYVAEADGPRLLFVGCLRDVDEFFVHVKGVPEMTAGDDVELRLIVPDAEWSLSGAVAITEDGAATFTRETDADAGAMKEIGEALLPVLSAPGPIVLQVGNSETVELTLEDLPPRIGIAGPLKTFEKICFRRR